MIVFKDRLSATVNELPSTGQLIVDACTSVASETTRREKERTQRWDMTVVDEESVNVE